MKSNYQNLNIYYLQKYSIFKQLAEPLFQSTPLKSFAYQRLYLGGNHFIFFTNKEYSQCFFDTVHELCPVAYETITTLSEGQIKFLLWNDKNMEPILSKLLYYNLVQGFTIYMRQQDFVDCYYFTGDRDSPNLNNFYINNINKILDIIFSFNEKKKEILTDNIKILGKHTGNNILTDFKTKVLANISKKSISVKSSFSQNLLPSFSTRELQCLEAISKGYSTKFIAGQLNLSPRTIECYIESIKRKANINFKDQLVDWFHKNKFNNLGEYG